MTKAPLTQDVITHGALKIIRVPPGHLGLGTLNGRPVVLGTGRHLINDPLFVYTRCAPMADFHIQIGVVHIITVPQGRVGLCTVNATAHFLEPGRHNICNERFAFVGFRDSTDEHISVGSKHRIVVPAGRVGLAWNAGEPLLLDPGRIYNIDSPTFRFVGSKSVVEPVIVHGRVKLVTVKQGSVGVSYDDGRLVILEVCPRARLRLPAPLTQPVDCVPGCHHTRPRRRSRVATRSPSHRTTWPAFCRCRRWCCR